MDIVAVSVNHHTAPVELREALHLSSDEIKQQLAALSGTYFKEGFIISTCNRTEIYGIPGERKIGYHELEHFLVSQKPVDGLTDSHFQKFFSCSAVNHLFRVAAGIDSLLVGDNQILGQVKESFQLAEEKNTVGFLLKRLFDAATVVGKRAKTETTISDGAITVSYAAVQLIEKIFFNLSKKSALVIGAGETGELAAKHLRDKGIGSLSVTNRTHEKAEKLAEMVRSQIIPFTQYKEHLHEFDIVISATSAPGYIIDYADVKQMLKKRNGATTVLMDIALPRDIDPKSREFDSVFYHDIDSLNVIVEQNMKKRRDEIPKVEKIILEEMVNFYSWYNSLEVAPTIKMMRDFFEAVRAEEVAKNINRFSEEDKEKIDTLTKRIINKLLHHPTMELRKAAEAGINSTEAVSKIGLIREMFGTAAEEKKAQ